MSGPLGEKCSECKFWYGVAEGMYPRTHAFHKQCRRMPPFMDPIPFDGEAVWHPGAWPCTPSEAWCGEFKKKEANASIT